MSQEQDLQSQLAIAREQLRSAQNQVAKLEAQLFADPAIPSTFLSSEDQLQDSLETQRRSEKRFRLLVDSVKDYAIYLLDTTGHIASWNTGAERLKGYTKDEIIGQHYARFFSVQDQQEGKPLRLLLGAESQGSIEDEGWRVRKDDSRFWANVVITALYNPNGSLYGFAKVTRDLTQRKQIEDAARHHAEEILQQALDKEKELGELKSRFVSMASHEFRTPLAVIRATADTLRVYRQKLPDDQIEKRLSKIQSQVESLKGIIEDVLQLTRLQSNCTDLIPIEFDLDIFCRTIIDELDSDIGMQQRIIYECDEALRVVALDKKFLRRIMSNIINNAIKYSSSDKQILVSLRKTENTIVFQVRDQGIGIPENDIKHLFQPFHRATNVENIAGTGLGLAITHESVKLLDGTIWVESQVDVGTTVTVSIPWRTKSELDNDNQSNR